MTNYQITLLHAEITVAVQRATLERLINAERLVRRLRRVNTIAATVLGFNVALLVYNLLRTGPLMAGIILAMTATLLALWGWWKRRRLT